MAPCLGAGGPQPSPAGYLSDTLLRSAAIPAVLMMASVALPGPSLTLSGSLGGPTSEARRRLDWAVGNGSSNAAQRAVREALLQAA